ncbi:ras-related protein Rab-31-like [Lineus longissimus]|uniref:ras-related protein Rab-31-like n=1 Tax=Lineus longissimus TaxID=88925 RepID=UPI002B4D4A61
MSHIKCVEAKIVVLGTQGVGKTSLVIRYIGNTFNKHASPTIGASFFTCKLAVDNYRVKLQVWDTAGQERFRSMAPMYYRKSNAAMLVFDLSSHDSFEDVKSWVTELKRNVEGQIVLCLLGNKCDLEDQREVEKTVALDYAASIGAIYFETSALSNEGIHEAFLQVALRLITLCETHPNSGMKLLSNSEMDGGTRLRAESGQSTSSTSSSNQQKSDCC